jgi:hypothetical protein
MDRHSANPIAPTGTLRASINLGNSLLAKADSASGAVLGVSVDLATAIADQLGVALQLVITDTAAKSVEAVKTGKADIGFFAIDPMRSAEIRFTAPYLLLEGCYLVRNESSITSNVQVDQPGNQVVVGLGSAYDLYLSRHLRHATIVRAGSTPAVVDAFMAQAAGPGTQLIAANIRQQLISDQARWPNTRLLPESFMQIAQAIGLASRCPEPALAWLDSTLQSLRAQQLVSHSLARHGISGVTEPY